MWFVSLPSAEWIGALGKDNMALYLVEIERTSISGDIHTDIVGIYDDRKLAEGLVEVLNKELDKNFDVLLTEWTDGINAHCTKYKYGKTTKIKTLNQVPRKKDKNTKSAFIRFLEGKRRTVPGGTYTPNCEIGDYYYSIRIYNLPETGSPFNEWIPVEIQTLYKKYMNKLNGTFNITEGAKVVAKCMVVE